MNEALDLDTWDCDEDCIHGGVECDDIKCYCDCEECTAYCEGEFYEVSDN